MSARQQERSEIKECAENRPAKGRESATGLLRRKVEVGEGKRRRRKGIKSDRRTRCVAERKGKERGLRREWQTRSLMYTCSYNKVTSPATRLPRNYTLQTAVTAGTMLDSMTTIGSDARHSCKAQGLHDNNQCVAVYMQPITQKKVPDGCGRRCMC